MILPTTYMGPVEWYRQFLANPSAVQIEVMESFPKQTYRNRCTITVPHDSQSNCQSPIANSLTLTVPVKRVDSKQFTRDVEISYQKRWQHQHWVSILSAYKSSPYFDHFAHRIEPFYRKEWKYLVDYNLEYTSTLLSLLGMNRELPLSQSYYEAQPDDLDLRPKHKESSTFVAEPYFQVFSDRLPFEANLSILDLIMCEGPQAVNAVLMRCRL